MTKKSAIAAKVCHLSFSDNGQEVTTDLEKLSRVWTIIFQIEQPMSRFKYLRVLDLSDSSL